MYLKAIEMQGFKSFPDKTVLDFGKGITAVVGPNGSGKSNLSDAMRWVLGEQSTKNLRGSKMEDVIFSGTDSRRAVGFAEVTLKLDNSDMALNNPQKTVTVTRRYYRSGESEYKINGETARLRDIHELFMDTGLGRDGYSMISQGKVETLISGKSEDRRDMLEEAAGISHYRYRRADAMRRLNQAEENLLRLRDILTELESRVGPLKVQSEKAQKFLEYAGEKKNLEIGLWLFTIEKTKNDLREYEKKITITDAQYNEVCKVLDEITGKIDSAIVDSQKITVAVDEIRRASTQLEEQAALLESQVAVQENTIEHNNETIERIEREKTEENDTDTEIARQMEEAQKVISELTDVINTKRQELESFSKELDSLSDENSKSAQRSIELSEKVSSLSLQIADNRVVVSTAASSIEEIENRIKVIEEAQENQQPIIDALVKEKNDVVCELERITERSTELNNSLSGIELLAEKRLEKLEKLKEQENNLRNEIQIKESRLNMLSDLEKNMEGYQGSVKAVMREVRRGTLKGIHAPVSRIISVSDKYSLAIETALGAQIQNIITDTENDAKKAIGFLKESRAGRATFLPLTAIKGRVMEEKGLDDCYGYINIASKLVEFQSKYSDVINSLLGRTVVAEDLDAAISIAKKFNYKFKIVTLDGQVVNAGGSMTGGAKLQNAGILSRGNEVERLKTQCEELAQNLEILLNDVRLQQENCSSVTAELDGCKAEITALGEDKIRVEGLLALKEGNLKNLTDAREQALEEKAQLKERINTINQNASGASEKLSQLQKEMEEVENELSALTGDRESLREKREKLTADAADINLEIATAQKEIEAKQEEITRLQGRSTSHKDKLSQLNDEIEEINLRNEEIRKRIEVLNAEAAGLREQSALSKEKIAEEIRKREQFEQETGKLRILEREKTEEREKLSGEKARLTERRDTMQKEFDDISNKLFDEYELTRREAEELNIVIEDVPEAKKRLNELKGKIRGLGNVNVAAIEEYKEVSERYNFMFGQVNDVEKSKAELIKLINELTGKMGVQFKEQFDKINFSFGQTFAELFGGGKAALVLTDENDVLECDIDIKVQPPGKNVQNISLLSGGEKGLSAIALLFSILKINPCPFCIFDEVEAALDDVNVVRYANYVRRMTDNTQFILITHRRGTMEEADMLYGVTMQEKGVSKLLELKTAEMASKFDLT
ncbi:MAG: chromosome segregation protein SMC [Ruminococcaceae bacterium]|nr:chromosome segregation protein SMC [Oscillospiraceae bacterium]